MLPGPHGSEESLTTKARLELVLPDELDSVFKDILARSAPAGDR
ncbi:MAG TPA: hypothetical protein VH092_35370 [Urbifossiella sp.]|nr:hypothetical protein [Urbifossiella sp.]